MKNKMKKVLIIIMFVISIVTNVVYAENTTEENQETNTNTQTNTNETENNTNNEEIEKPEEEKNEIKPEEKVEEKKEETPKKSSDANLKNLGIRPHDFSGFKPDTLKYEVSVPNDTESIEIYAEVKDKGAKVTGTGTKKLDEGENEFAIVVTAEDGTVKTYVINVTRELEENDEEEEEENTENVQERYSGEGLSSLKIGDLDLSPSFDTIIYEYTVKYIGEETELKIETETTDPYYEVEVIGNKELVEGENVITILVSDPDGENVATYQIIVNKSLVDEEALAREEAERKREEQTTMIIIIGIVVGIVGIIVFLLIRRKRNQTWAEEYTVPFAGINEEKNQLEDYDTNMNYIKEDKEELSKEKIKEQFLNEYNADNNDEFDIEEIIKKKKHKGKRFK